MFPHSIYLELLSCLCYVKLSAMQFACAAEDFSIFFSGYFWYSLAMSFEFSMIQSLILRGRW